MVVVIPNEAKTELTDKEKRLKFIHGTLHNLSHFGILFYVFELIAGQSTR